MTTAVEKYLQGTPKITFTIEATFGPYEMRKVKTDYYIVKKFEQCVAKTYKFIPMIENPLKKNSFAIDNTAMMFFLCPALSRSRAYAIWQDIKVRDQKETTEWHQESDYMS